jgi:hypothetical protein
MKLTRIKHIILFTLLLVISISESLSAQENSGGYVGSFTRMGFSPRGIASANAMVSNLSDGSYGVYNPALAALSSDTTQIDVATTVLPFDRQLNMVHSHFQLPPSAGLSISLLHARVGGIDGRDLNGFHTGTLSTNEFQVIGQFAIRFSERFWGGVGIKYNHARLHEEVNGVSSVGVDAGLLLRLTSKLNIGLAVRDLLASYRFNTSDLYGTESAAVADQYFPVRTTGGITYQFTDRLNISVDLERRFYRFEESDPSGQTQRIEESSAATFHRIGARYLIHERVTLRGGAEIFKNADGRRVRPAAGFSLHLPLDRFSPSIDYAYAREPSLQSTMHTFSIRLNL